MGTSMAFYHVKNQGFTREKLHEIMTRSFQGQDQRTIVDDIFENIRKFDGEEALREYKRIWEQTIQTDKSFSSVIGYRPDAPWLPFFDTGMCDGYNASSMDARRLSKIFGAPVIAFSIFDSDILMVSYSDAEKNIDHDYAKPNWEGMEEYDTELFRTDIPEFLLFLCPGLTREKLTEIWEGEEVFADERMGKLCKALKMFPIYQADSIPDGFEAIQADQT